MQTFVNQQNEAFTDEEDFSANEDEDSAELEMMDSGIVMDSVNWEKMILVFFRNVQNCEKKASCYYSFNKSNHLLFLHSDDIITFFG